MALSVLTAWLGLASGSPAQTGTPRPAWAPASSSRPVFQENPSTPGSFASQRSIVFAGGQEEKEPPAIMVYPHAPQGGIQRVGGIGKRYSDDDVDFNINTEYPGADKLFGTRDSESQFRERLRVEANSRPGSGRIFFPEEPPLTKERHMGRMFPPRAMLVEPAFVAHGRIYFEQRNIERQGWDLGILTPPLSVAKFYYDVAMFPYHYWTRPLQRYDTSAGKCLPGDSTPLLLYPEEWSITGLIGLGATYTGGAYLFR